VRTSIRVCILLLFACLVLLIPGLHTGGLINVGCTPINVGA